jgi:uncharacterized protein YbaP (TraB family)
MARLIGLLFAGAVLALAAPGCARQPQPGPALWRLADSDSEIWLLGSVHVLPPTLKWRTKRIDKAFEAADTIYFETPTDSVGRGDIAMLMTRYGFNPKGVTLSSLLDPADNARLRAACAVVKIDPAALEPERPWLAAVQLSVAFVLQHGQAAEAGVERVLDQEARQDGKARAYFETPEEQIRFFADLSTPAEVGFLRSSMAEIQQADQSVDVMDQAWARGDVKTLGAYLESELKDAGPDIYEALIARRNARWADEIDQMMKGRGKIFIAVGAAHLIGKDSVTALLRKKGYKVEGP